jgi:hypothetical protein
MRPGPAVGDQVPASGRRAGRVPRRSAACVRGHVIAGPGREPGLRTFLSGRCHLAVIKFPLGMSHLRQSEGKRQHGAYAGTRTQADFLGLGL